MSLVTPFGCFAVQRRGTPSAKLTFHIEWDEPKAIGVLHAVNNDKPAGSTGHDVVFMFRSQSKGRQLICDFVSGNPPRAEELISEIGRQTWMK